LTAASKTLVPGKGPKPAAIALVGEAPGVNEVLYKTPFVGSAGDELNRILSDSGIQRKDCYATNVFKLRPLDNDISNFFTTRADPAACLDLPPYRKGSSLLYLHSQYRPMVADLLPELVGVEARVVVALGATALWGLLGYSKISSYVGTVHSPILARPFFVIPTYHPAAVLRNWSFRTTVLANLTKVHECLTQDPDRLARRSSYSPGADFRIKINPTLDEIRIFASNFGAKPDLYPAVAVDVETMHGQIRTISFTTSPKQAFVIPFWEPPAGSYWPTLEGELQAWAHVRSILSHTDRTYIFHNGDYDIQYLWRVHGIPVLGAIEDTMHAHHAMEHELPKSLGELAATYLKLPEWKTMRLKSEKED